MKVGCPALSKLTVTCPVGCSGTRATVRVERFIACMRCRTRSPRSSVPTALTKSTSCPSLLACAAKLNGAPPRCSVCPITSHNTSPMLMIFMSCSSRSRLLAYFCDEYPKRFKVQWPAYWYCVGLTTGRDQWLQLGAGGDILLRNLELNGLPFVAQVQRHNYIFALSAAEVRKNIGIILVQTGVVSVKQRGMLMPQRKNLTIEIQD